MTFRIWNTIIYSIFGIKGGENMDEFDMLVEFIFNLFERYSRGKDYSCEDMDDHFKKLINTLNDEQKSMLYDYDFDTLELAMNYAKGTIKFFLTGLCPCLFDQVD